MISKIDCSFFSTKYEIIKSFRRERCLVPQLNEVVPAAGEDARGLVRMPLDIHADLTVRLDLVIQARRLPVPDAEAAVRVARYHVAHVGREVDAARVTGHHVPAE